MRSRTSRSTRLAFSLAVAVTLAVGALLPGRWSSAQSPSELVGDYAVSISSGDIPEDLASGAVLVGRWHVAFRADGTYFAERNDIGTVVTGSYGVDGDALTVTDEAGLVSCSNAAAAVGDQGDVSTGTYTVTRDEDLLALTKTEDACRTRSILFGTRDFGLFVACLTSAQAGDASPVASPESAEATPVADDELSTGRDEQSGDGGDLFDLLTPKPDDSSSDSPSGETATEVDQEIDALLGQMTACWQTQEAEQFLPLLTDDFREAFLGAGTEEEQIADLEQLMIQPLVWERAGDIELDGDDTATVVVRLSIAGSDQFLTYRFLLGGDGWRWDGQEA